MSRQEESSKRQHPVENRTAADALDELLVLMARLRDPQRGCPWDREQDFDTIAPYTIEEAYEVADAIARRSLPSLCDELGDLLFQVVFHARIAEEQGAFDFSDVARGIVRKMESRHPHVFGDAAERSAAEQSESWEATKAAERAAARPDGGLLDDVALALPALMRAEKLTKRAARIGFDWPDADRVLEKLDEELGELAEARRSGDAGHVAEEMGDALFVMANLARKLGIDPEAALRNANAKFTRRFSHIEQSLKRREADGAATLEEMEALWVEAKTIERS